MLIDIIIPVFNAQNTIQRAIDSILSQKDKSLNIILVDDGSTDKTRLICEDYVKKFNNVKYYYQQNSGPGAARKNGFKNSSGEYVMFCDADDYFLPGLKEAISEIKNFEQYDIIEFGFQSVNEQGSVRQSRKLIAEDVEDCIGHYIKQSNTTNYLWNKIFKRNIIRIDDFAELYFSEDACFLASAYMRAKHNIVIEKVLYSYVLLNTSACRGKVDEKRLDIIKADNHIMNLIKGNRPDLIPYEACTACSHAAQIYSMFYDAGIINKYDQDIEKQFDVNYELLKRKKLKVYKNSSIKRWMAIEIFNVSPIFFSKMVRRII